MLNSDFQKGDMADRAVMLMNSWRPRYFGPFSRRKPLFDRCRTPSGEQAIESPFWKRAEWRLLKCSKSP